MSDKRMNRTLYTVEIRILKNTKVKKSRTASFYGLKLANIIFGMMYGILSHYNTLGVGKTK